MNKIYENEYGVRIEIIEIIKLGLYDEETITFKMIYDNKETYHSIRTGSFEVLTKLNGYKEVR